MKKPVLFLQNITLETPGNMLPFLENRNIPYKAVDLYANETADRNPNEFGAVVILGGPMNVDEEHLFPFLKTEKEFIRACYQNRVPLLGICLGGQLMAAAAGAAVRKNPEPEIGWMEVELNQAGQSSILFDGLPSPLPVFQWHGDTFDIPENGTVLAHSRLCQNQAFVFNQNSFGVQFHFEITLEDTQRWAEEYLEDTSEPNIPVVMDLIQHPNSEKAAELSLIAERLMENFFIRNCGYQ